MREGPFFVYRFSGRCTSSKDEVLLQLKDAVVADLI